MAIRLGLVAGEREPGVGGRGAAAGPGAAGRAESAAAGPGRGRPQAQRQGAGRPAARPQGPPTLQWVTTLPNESGTAISVRIIPIANWVQIYCLVYVLLALSTNFEASHFLGPRALTW